MKIETGEDAVMLRGVLEPIWSEYYAANGRTRAVPSTNMCCRTAWMVNQIDPRWTVVHGSVDGLAHAWCERADGTVLDITADQFGEPTVIFGDLPDRWLEDDPHDSDWDDCEAARTAAVWARTAEAEDASRG